MTLILPGVTRSAYGKTTWIYLFTHFLTERGWNWYGGDAILAEHANTTFKWDLVNQGK